MYYSFDALNCCVVCALFFSVVGFFVTHIDLALKVISTIILFFVQLLILFLWLPIFCAFCWVASLHPLTQVCISILTGFLLFCGGCSDLLVRFTFFILQLALCSAGGFCLEIYLIGSLYESVVFSVVFIACGTFYLFIYFTFICLTFLISSIYHYGIVVLWA